MVRLHIPLVPVPSCAAVLALTAAACTQTPPAQPLVAEKNIYIGERPVYAVLVPRDDGHWTFDRITAEDSEPSKGFLVRLNDLAPAFDTRRVECEPRPYRENDRCNPLHPFRNKDVGVVGKIVETGISAGTGGKIDSISRSYETEFDHLAFNAAVDEALLATGLDEGRKALLTNLSRLAEISGEHDRTIANLTQRMLREYRDDKDESLVIDLRVTGLEEYYAYDIDPADFVRIEAKMPAYTQTGSEATAADVLPCDASHCVANINAAIGELERSHQQRIAELRATLAEATSTYTVDCSATKYAGYHFELTCPEELRRSEGGAMVLPVQMKIRSRDYAHLFPHFEERDRNLAAVVDGDELVLENLTDEFIDVQSLSVYYNSQINTIRDSGAKLDLAPRQKLSQPLAALSSPEIEIESEHANMTPDKARRTSFRFGLAVKYSLRDRSSIETIYAVDEFDVQCAIENRLHPGSCRPQAEPGIAVTEAQGEFEDQPPDPP